MAKELQELGQWKVGQEVLWEAGGASLGKSIEVIERITDGRGGSIYLKDNSGSGYDSNGFSRNGGAFHRAYITPMTPELKAQITVESRRQKLSRFDWKNLPDEQINQVITFMREKGIKI